jgi:uncharacterized protein (TIGR00369 family)
MNLAANEADLQKLLEDVQFTRQLGLRLHSIGDGECVLDVPFRPTFERPGGIVSGQVFMAAADVAMWLAIMTKLGMNEVAVTVEMKTNFLSAARREGFLCKARILKLGQRLVYGYAECMNGEGKLLTHHTITYIRTDPADAP